MPRRRIGQEMLFQDAPKRSSLDEIAGLIDWAPVEVALDVIHAARRGQLAAAGDVQGAAAGGLA